MQARDYSIIGPMPDLFTQGRQDGFLGLPDTSQDASYLLGYSTGGAEFARLQLEQSP